MCSSKSSSNPLSLTGNPAVAASGARNAKKFTILMSRLTRDLGQRCLSGLIAWRFRAGNYLSIA